MPDNDTNGQVDGATPGQDTPPTTTTDFVTRKDFDNAISEVKDLVSKSYQGSQSHTAKMVKNAQDTIETRFGQVLRSLGHNVSDDAIAEATRKMVLDDIVDERLASSTGASEPGPGKSTGDDATSGNYEQYVSDLGDQLCEKLGVEFVESDPEWKDLSAVAEKGSALDYLDEIRKQADIKKKRLASSREARLPAVPGEGGPANPLEGLGKERGPLWEQVRNREG